jgi:hypothetical protein
MTLIVLDTLIDLERQGKLKAKALLEKRKKQVKKRKKESPKTEEGLGYSIKKLFKKSMSSSFILKDHNGEQFLNFPLLVCSFINSFYSSLLITITYFLL